MRVLMLIENTAYGHDQRVQHEAGTLLHAGYEVTVIGPRPERGRFHDVIDGVHCYQFPPAREAEGALGYVWEYGWSMVAIFVLSLYVWIARGIDVIHAANPPDTLCLIAAFYKLFGKRFVFDHHDLAPEMYDVRFPDGGKAWISRLLYRFERLSCRLADHVIASNESYRRLDCTRNNVPPQRITVVRNGPDDIAAPAFIPDLDSPGRTVIAYVGAIGFQDGVDQLLVALDDLVHGLERTNVLCLILGDGVAVPALKQQARGLGLQDVMRFTGWVPHGHVAGYLAAADLCAAPEPSNAYTEQSTTIKLMEYMAAGKPIVAFDLTEHRVTAGEAALYAPPGDTWTFAQRIAFLMDHPDARRRLGQIGQARIEARLAWRHQAPHLLRAYRALLLTTVEDNVYAEP